MYSQAFLAYQDKIPTAPPTAMAGPGQPGMGPGPGGQIPPEYAHLNVPMQPPDTPSPEPELPAGFSGGRVTVGGVPGMRLTRDGVRPHAALLYIHGGGFTLGSGMTAGPLLAHFLEKTNLEGYSVDYSLAPYAKFPVAVNQCVDFYRGLLESGIDRIVVGGESAGAGMTLSLVHALKLAGLPLPAAIWCSSPVDNIDFGKCEVFRQDMFTASGSDIIEAYAGDADLTDPRLSPIYGDFSNFPPAFIQAGGGESLAAGALRIVDKLVRTDCEVRFTLGKGMPHTFAMDYALYPEAENAMNEIMTFINNILDLQ